MKIVSVRQMSPSAGKEALMEERIEEHPASWLGMEQHHVFLKF